MFFEIEMPTKH